MKTKHLSRKDSGEPQSSDKTYAFEVKTSRVISIQLKKVFVRGLCCVSWVFFWVKRQNEIVIKCFNYFQKSCVGRCIQDSIFLIFLNFF